jgi:mRNA-degrading endonuclease RelE of RelBE toxin-antitoxin system
MSVDYRVEWWDDALDDLAREWVESGDRNRLTLWATGIDEALAREPEKKGIEIAEGLRRLRFGPYRAYYQISPTKRLVEIVAVRRAP